MQIRQSATKLLNDLDSMEKAQRLDVEVDQPIIHPRVPNSKEMI